MKDVPTEIPEGTVLSAYLTREDTRDVFVSNRYKSIRELPDGAVVGSSSLRRQAQILAINPTLRVVNFRGNVQTRLRKLGNGDVDATILAHAGLRRLKMDELIGASNIITWEDMLPAVAQGAIGIQCRSDDKSTIKYVQTFSHFPTELAVRCERAFLAELEGNCRTPIAGQAKLLANNTLVFRGLVATCDGLDILPVQMSLDACVSVEQASDLGTRAAKELKRIAGPERMKKFHESADEFMTKNGQSQGWAKRN
jgi:hydroxymethylbilane synthase